MKQSPAAVGNRTASRRIAGQIDRSVVPQPDTRTAGILAGSPRVRHGGRRPAKGGSEGRKAPPAPPFQGQKDNEKATRQQGGFFFRENSSNGGKAIRTFLAS
jgi:hypothetical protein